MNGSETTSAPVSVVVADDHPMWRDAVARDLGDAGFVVVGTAADGSTALSQTLEHEPDVLVLDLNLPRLRGPQVCARLADRQLRTRILILSVSAEHRDVLACVKAGAQGYLVKSASRAEFLDAVGRTAAGEAVFTPGLAGLVLGEYRRLQNDPAPPTEPAAPQLTEREIEILRYVATGVSYKDIAASLSISHRTVQNHVQNTLTKLRMHNRVELARYAISKGLDKAP